MDGLWATGPAACEAKLGVRFEGGAVAAQADDESQVILDQPSYTIERRGARVRVRIDYAAPVAAGAHHVAQRGVLVLERDDDGWLRARSHRLEDPRTGAAQIRLRGDPITQIFRLRRCGPDAWIEGLRGRDEAENRRPQRQEAPASAGAPQDLRVEGRT